ncbi:MAG: class I SAM-dependent methyltransferase [Desulforhopalus sp.]
MGTFEPKFYNDIDWTVLRANAIDQMGRKPKGPQDWDEKARSFAGRNKSTAYVSRFLAHLPLTPEMTVLDVGSGPGTLAMPIAKKVHKVTAIDFSQGMLDTLDELARAENITNISTIRCAWEDDWTEKGIVPHDIAVASRSMGVKDLEPAIRKIDSFATKYVFLSDRIGATPFEKGAFAALGRQFSAGPDYIYTLNILYTLGIHPNVTVLNLEQDVTYSSMEEAVQSYRWMFHDITADELTALENYIAGKIIDSDDNKITVRRDSPPRWALIWWPKDAYSCIT